ncbi:MAG: glycosyltransferase family 2 protein [Bacilli bacterium]|nr:glycosyltransferase family 2 protein [Bacilli bacterium]
MNNKKLFSIIIPIYNSANTLERCIDSIIKQDYKNLEIILVNDGSKDNSLKICEKYKKMDNRIILINKENGGVSSARNEGLKIAKGEYISFVDSDDYIEKNMYTLISNTFEKNACDVVIFNMFFENDNNEIIYDLNHSNFNFKKFDFPTYSYYTKTISGYACNKVYSRKLIYQENHNIKFNCDVYIAEDSLFGYEVFNNSKDISYSYINDRLYHYVLSNSSATNTTFNYKKLTYFDVIKKEIEILNDNNINNSFLKADYIINSVRYNVFMKKNNFKYDKRFEKIKITAKKFKKEINYKELRLDLIIKLIIANYFPFFYKFLLKNKNI